MIKVKIISSNNKQNWYHNRVNEVFEADGTRQGFYVILGSTGIYEIDKNDCEIYQEEPKISNEEFYNFGQPTTFS